MKRSAYTWIVSAVAVAMLLAMAPAAEAQPPAPLKGSYLVIDLNGGLMGCYDIARSGAATEWLFLSNHTVTAEFDAETPGLSHFELFSGGATFWHFWFNVRKISVTGNCDNYGFASWVSVCGGMPNPGGPACAFTSRFKIPGVGWWHEQGTLLPLGPGQSCTACFTMARARGEEPRAVRRLPKSF